MKTQVERVTKHKHNGGMEIVFRVHKNFLWFPEVVRNADGTLFETPKLEVAEQLAFELAWQPSVWELLTTDVLNLPAYFDGSYNDSQHASVVYEMYNVDFRENI
ncbi:hypothetical protein AHIS1_p011 [Acaryochloris phage A-HIS1]|nr:hypothetical protein AHIS1_p011 [Acaryochloris phage A-HIS1]